MKKSALTIAIIGCISLGGIYSLQKAYSALKSPEKNADFSISKELLSQSVAPFIQDSKFPNQLVLKQSDQQKQVKVQYTLDPTLQYYAQRLFQSYDPNYGAFAAIDVATGKILALVSYTERKELGNLATRATFPAASVFKMVTATAAIENSHFNEDTVISYNGSNHTLYKKNLFDLRYTRWTRQISLKDAFAKSINTVFGKLGVYTLGPATLTEYSQRFAFNRDFNTDFPLQQAHFSASSDPFTIAQLASGFNKETTLSPVHGAALASAVINGGTVMKPYLIESITDSNGSVEYKAAPEQLTSAMTPETAETMKELMRQTVAKGTSRKAFRKMIRGKMLDIDVGGKTGSLTGDDPKGKYDWFVGFAEHEGRKIAFATLAIHGKLRKLRSTEYSRKVIEQYFFANKKLASR